MKWIGHHLKKAMSKFTPTGYGQAHKTIMLAKVIERAYEQAERNGITAEELTNALAKRMGKCVELRNGEPCEMHESGKTHDGGGGGRAGAGVLEVGLVHSPTTNLKVVSSPLVVQAPSNYYEKEALDAAHAAYQAKYWGPEEVHAPTTKLTVSSESQVIYALPSVEAERARIADPVADVPEEEMETDDLNNPCDDLNTGNMYVVDTPKPPEGPQWPQKASVRVSGPCPNPRVWAGAIASKLEGEHLTIRSVSLESSPTRQWKRGEVVEAELIRGGGSPIYRAIL